jgi:hypothetical protein
MFGTIWGIRDGEEDVSRLAAADEASSSTTGISATRNCCGATFHTSQRCKFQARAHASLFRPVRKEIECTDTGDGNGDGGGGGTTSSANEVKMRSCFSSSSSFSANPNNHCLLINLMVEDPKFVWHAVHPRHAGLGLLGTEGLVNQPDTTEGSAVSFGFAQKIRFHKQRDIHCATIADR